jgi:hypothetical protein
MAPLVELKAEGAFFRVWLRRELQRGKYAGLKLNDEQWGERLTAEEEHYLDFCRRLAFAMFKRGVTSWTVQHEEPVAQGKASLRQQMKAKHATAKVLA